MPEEVLTADKYREIHDTQGTRLSSKAPWETYDAEMGVKESAQLEAEIADYSSRRHEKSSSQNEEELCRQREFANESAKEYQFIKPGEYADEGPRVGRVMSHAEFINTLRKAGIRCWYRQHPQHDKVTLLCSKSSVQEPEVACWVQFGQMPEYSFMNFDEHGVPLAEKRRGWRTCLLQMILKGFISEQYAKKVFGEARGPASSRFNSTLYAWRQKQFEE